MSSLEAWRTVEVALHGCITAREHLDRGAHDLSADTLRTIALLTHGALLKLHEEDREPPIPGLFSLSVKSLTRPAYNELAVETEDEYHTRFIALLEQAVTQPSHVVDIHVSLGRGTRIYHFYPHSNRIKLREKYEPALWAELEKLLRLIESFASRYDGTDRVPFTPLERPFVRQAA